MRSGERPALVASTPASVAIFSECNAYYPVGQSAIRLYSHLMTKADAAEVRVEHSADLTAKARIRNAAMELFATKGAANTSIREVAAAAGITHGLVVHHFANKDGLRQAVRQHAIELLW